MNKPKAFILLIALLSFSFLQCEKGDGNEKSNNPYTGEWELLSISGGFAGNGYTADFSILYLGGDATYWIGDSNGKIAEGTYEVYQKENEDWIRFDSDNSQNQHIFETQDKMISFDVEEKMFLTEPCCDLYQYEFKKLKDDDR
jgi:hypothetical protein